ncbi:hypothetical protein JOF36_005994 [Pseudonocardia parietis]|uniref:Carrier domain-containing protein n=1 Tax=Pseudonocardia parietis TaxID=570936 RepID=A0ABS4W2X6_9PSEU|nr:phosphopantetheine-binding protein [Pseudonocardia parietis]MBP2370298.1 hypothetical protein [Pseudonocardia parietis]
MAEGEIGPDDDLFSLGLDSLRLMTLRSAWRRRGAAVDLVALAEAPTPRPVYPPGRSARSPRACAPALSHRRLDAGAGEVLGVTL